jgi:hypothetical protein
MSTTDVSAALTALEALASANATSSSGPLNTSSTHTLPSQRSACWRAAQACHHRAAGGGGQVEEEKGLKAWYARLGGLGKNIEKVGACV